MNQSDETPCQIRDALRVFDGRWKSAIVWWLNQRSHRFGELRRALPDATAKVLTQQLRELERDGIVRREAYDEKPPRVAYSKTPLCDTLTPLLNSIYEWGARHGGAVDEARANYDAAQR